MAYRSDLGLQVLRPSQNWNCYLTYRRSRLVSSLGKLKSAKTNKLYLVLLSTLIPIGNDLILQSPILPESNEKYSQYILSAHYSTGYQRVTKQIELLRSFIESSLISLLIIPNQLSHILVLFLIQSIHQLCKVPIKSRMDCIGSIFDRCISKGDSGQTFS